MKPKLSRRFSSVVYRQEFHQPEVFTQVFTKHSHLTITANEDMIPTLMFLSDHPTKWFVDFVEALLGTSVSDVSVVSLTQLVWYFYLCPLPIVVSPREAYEILHQEISEIDKFLYGVPVLKWYKSLTGTPFPESLIIRSISEGAKYGSIWELAKDTCQESPHRIFRVLCVLSRMVWLVDDYNVQHLKSVDMSGVETLPKYRREYLDILYDYVRHYRTSTHEALEESRIFPTVLSRIISDYIEGDNLEDLTSRLGMVIPEKYQKFPLRTQYFFQEYPEYQVRFETWA